MKKTINLFLVISIISTLFSCDSNENPFVQKAETHRRGNVKIFVEESYMPLFKTSIYTFQSQFPNAKINTNYCTEQTAIEAFMTKKTKAIFISRDFTKEEKEKLKLNQVEVRSIKLADDAVALIVHPNNKDTTMSVSRLKRILTGKDTLWNGSKNKIDIVFDNQNSANFKYLNKLTNNAPVPANIFAVKSNKEVINYVKNHPNAIGVIGVNWISDEDDSEVLGFLDGVVVMSLSSKENGEYFKPYQAYIHTKDYPLTRELWSINKSGKQSLFSGFINFLNGEAGQLIIQKSCLVPANSPIRMIEIKAE